MMYAYVTGSTGVMGDDRRDRGLTGGLIQRQQFGHLAVPARCPVCVGSANARRTCPLKTKPPGGV
jgi:hypothetical protein